MGAARLRPCTAIAARGAMSSARPIALVLLLVPALAAAQPGSDSERKRREIERQLQLPKGTPPPPAPAPPPEPEPPPPAPAPGGAPAAPVAPPPTLFAPEIHGLLVGSCKSCHVTGGPAGTSRLVLQGKARADFDAVRPFVDTRRPRESL